MLLWRRSGAARAPHALPASLVLRALFPFSRLQLRVSWCTPQTTMGGISFGGGCTTASEVHSDSINAL